MRRLLQIVSTVALILYFVFLSLLLSYFLFLTREENSLNKKIEINEEKIKSLKPVESKYVLLKSKLKELVEILKLEEKPKETLLNLESLIVEGISMEGIDYSGKELKIRGQAESVLILDKFVKELEKEGKSFFSQAEFEGVGRSEEGKYYFTLSLSR